MENVPCPKCETRSGFVEAGKFDDRPSCFTCNDTLVISEEHSQLLALGFLETYSFESYSLFKTIPLGGISTAQSSVSFTLTRTQDGFDVGREINNVQIYDELNTAEQIIRFIKNLN